MRPRNTLRLGFVATASCIVAGGLAAATPAQSATGSSRPNAALSSTREAIIDCTNRERAKHGLRALRPSRTLRRAAQYHAGNMLRHRFFAHTDTLGRDPAERVQMFQKRNSFHYIGENIAAGWGTGAAACRSWIVSSKHRHNILDPDYKMIGVGYASGDKGYGTYFVQNFGG